MLQGCGQRGVPGQHAARKHLLRQRHELGEGRADAAEQHVDAAQKTVHELVRRGDAALAVGHLADGDEKLVEDTRRVLADGRRLEHVFQRGEALQLQLRRDVVAGNGVEKQRQHDVHVVLHERRKRLDRVEALLDEIHALHLVNLNALHKVREDPVRVVRHHVPQHAAHCLHKRNDVYQQRLHRHRRGRLQRLLSVHVAVRPPLSSVEHRQPVLGVVHRTLLRARVVRGGPGGQVGVVLVPLLHLLRQLLLPVPLHHREYRLAVGQHLGARHRHNRAEQLEQLRVGVPAQRRALPEEHEDGREDCGAVLDELVAGERLEHLAGGVDRLGVRCLVRRACEDHQQRLQGHGGQFVDERRLRALRGLQLLGDRCHAEVALHARDVLVLQAALQHLRLDAGVGGRRVLLQLARRLVGHKRQLLVVRAVRGVPARLRAALLVGGGRRRRRSRTDALPLAVAELGVGPERDVLRTKGVDGTDGADEAHHTVLQRPVLLRVQEAEQDGQHVRVVLVEVDDEPRRAHDLDQAVHRGHPLLAILEAVEHKRHELETQSLRRSVVDADQVVELADGGEKGGDERRVLQREAVAQAHDDVLQHVERLRLDDVRHHAHQQRQQLGEVHLVQGEVAQGRVARELHADTRQVREDSGRRRQPAQHQQRDGAVLGRLVVERHEQAVQDGRGEEQGDQLLAVVQQRQHAAAYRGVHVHHAQVDHRLQEADQRRQVVRHLHRRHAVARPLRQRAVHEGGGLHEGGLGGRGHLVVQPAGQVAQKLDGGVACGQAHALVLAGQRGRDAALEQVAHAAERQRHAVDVADVLQRHPHVLHLARREHLLDDRDVQLVQRRLQRRDRLHHALDGFGEVLRQRAAAERLPPLLSAQLHLHALRHHLAQQAQQLQRVPAQLGVGETLPDVADNAAHVRVEVLAGHVVAQLRQRPEHCLAVRRVLLVQVFDLLQAVLEILAPEQVAERATHPRKHLDRHLLDLHLVRVHTGQHGIRKRAEVRRLKLPRRVAQQLAKAHQRTLRRGRVLAVQPLENLLYGLGEERRPVLVVREEHVQHGHEQRDAGKQILRDLRPHGHEQTVEEYVCADGHKLRHRLQQRLEDSARAEPAALLVHRLPQPLHSTLRLLVDDPGRQQPAVAVHARRRQQRHARRRKLHNLRVGRREADACKVVEVRDLQGEAPVVHVDERNKHTQTEHLCGSLPCKQRLDVLVDVLHGGVVHDRVRGSFSRQHVHHRLDVRQLVRLRRVHAQHHAAEAVQSADGASGAAPHTVLDASPHHLWSPHSPTRGGGAGSSAAALHVHRRPLRAGFTHSMKYRYCS
eukprot:Rhum_TRINITY_DN14788_c20_g1::Rhum_TRINITY_DN14788_c20_g1_i1::g.119160::m.119160